MKLDLEIEGDIPFILKNEATPPAQGGLPKHAAFLTNYTDSVIIAEAELSEI